MEKILARFYSGVYENSINKQMMYYEYAFPYEQVEAYVQDIISVSISCFLEYIYNSGTIEFTAKDIFQFSSFDDCTVNICRKLKAHNNPGVTHLSGGKLLLDDGKVRNNIAYTKYGENHLKTGESLGLLFCLTNTYFVSAIGMIYCSLEDTDKEKLLTRLVLRCHLIARMLQASKNGNVDMRQFLYMLSDSTYVRRRSNIKRVLSILMDSKEYDFSLILDHFIFDKNKPIKNYYPSSRVQNMKVAESIIPYGKDGK